MEQQTWVTLAGVIVGFAAFTLTLFGYLRAMKQELKVDIGRVDDKIDRINGELGGNIGALDAKFEDKFGKLDVKIDRTREELTAELRDLRTGIRELEHRTYDLRGQQPAG